MDKLYTIQEVATKLNLSDKTLRRWEEAGRFSPSRTLGNQRRYTLEDIQILDAIKHNTINAQSDLLNVAQAGQFCGVSPTTITRWENEGKIHPLITSGNTYYPKQKLAEKMEELQNTARDQNLIIPPTPDEIIKSAPIIESQPSYQSPVSALPPRDMINPVKLTPLSGLPTKTIKLTEPNHNSSPISYLTNAVITLIIVLTYHFLFNQTSTPISPQPTPASGSVQGASTSASSEKLDDLILKFQNHLASEMLKDSKPAPVTTINLSNTDLITGSAKLPKGQDQVSVTHPSISEKSAITASFTSDYSPAKKYWITTAPGSFTLHTDFPVGTDSTFNYSLFTPTSTDSAKNN